MGKASYLITVNTLSSNQNATQRKETCARAFPSGKGRLYQEGCKEPPPREETPKLWHRSRYTAQAQLVAHGEMARIRPPPTPEEDPEHAPEGSSCDRPILQHPRSKHRRRDVQAAQQVQT